MKPVFLYKHDKHVRILITQLITLFTYLFIFICLRDSPVRSDVNSDNTGYEIFAAGKSRSNAQCVKIERANDRGGLSSEWDIHISLCESSSFNGPERFVWTGMDEPLSAQPCIISNENSARGISV